MKMGRTFRRRTSVAGLLVVGVVAGSLAALPAGAAPSTKWFTDTVGTSSNPTGSTVVYPVSSTGQTLYLQINNAADSNQSFGSADVDLLNDWSWSTPQITTSTGVESHWTGVIDSNNNHLIHLRNDGVGSQYGIPPGGWLQLRLTFTSPAGGIDVPTFVVKQSNDFSDSSTRGTSNVFGQRSPAAAIYIGAGPPAKIVYTQAPSDVRMTSTATGTNYMCPPVKAAVEDSSNNVVTWLPATAVTLSSTGFPGLKLNGSTTLSANTSGGVATFGAGDTTSGCTAGLTAANQGSYALTASTTVAAGAGYAGGTFSTAAAGYTVYLTLCGASCDVPLSGSQTTAGVHGSGGDGTPTPFIGLISAAGTLPSGCDSAHISYRPEQTTVLLEGHDKTVDVGWSKKVTNQDPRNGTPFWPVCFQGPDVANSYFVYSLDTSGQLTLADAQNGALLALCSTTGVHLRSDNMPDHACIQNLYKNAASEHAVIWIPNLPGDPHMW